MDIQKSTAKRFYTIGKNAVQNGDFIKADWAVKLLNKHRAWFHARVLCRLINRQKASDEAFLSSYPGGLSA